MRCRITSGGGDPRESATENEPPAFALRGFGEVRVKRCGKSAPRFRQRSRHGKPHREQNRIGTAERAVRESDNAAGRCQARRPGRLLEATCKHGPRGMAVTYRARKRAVPYRTRLTGRLMCDEGFGANASDPSPFRAGRRANQPPSFRGKGAATQAARVSAFRTGASAASRRSLPASKPCMPSCHCRATMAPLVGCSSASEATSVTGNHTTSWSHSGGA